MSGTAADVSNYRTSLFVAALLCAAIRVACLHGADRLPLSFPTDGYTSIAANILEGKGFHPDPLSQYNIRTPGYPLLIAAVWFFSDPSCRFITLAAVQVSLSVATCCLIFMLASRFYGQRIAFLASILFSISPSQNIHSLLVFPETLQLFLISFAAFLVCLLHESKQPILAFSFGIVWGLAGLTRPESTFLLPLLLAPVILMTAIGWKRRFAVLTAAVLGKAIVMAPWIVRNLLIYGAFVMHLPFSGTALFTSTYPHPPTYGRGWSGSGENLKHISMTSQYEQIVAPYRTADESLDNPNDVERVLIVDKEIDFLLADQQFRRQAMDNIRNYPSIQLYNAVCHLHDLWARPAAWGILQIGPCMKLTWFVAYVTGLFLALVGFNLVARFSSLQSVPFGWLLMFVGHSALFVISGAEPRYHMSVSVFLCIFMAVAIDAILRTVLPRSVGISQQ